MQDEYKKTDPLWIFIIIIIVIAAGAIGVIVSGILN